MIKTLRASILLFLFCFTSQILVAQYLGAFASLNNSKLAGDKPKGFRVEAKFGYEFGAVVEFEVSKDVLLSIRPGYYHSVSEIRVRDKSVQERRFKDSLEASVNYLNIPVHFKINFTKKERWYFISGLLLGIHLDSTVKNDLDEKTDISDSFEALNVALEFGLGHQIPLSNSYFFIEMRYTQGFSDVTDFNNPADLLSRVKLQGIQWTGGYVIPLKKK